MLNSTLKKIEICEHISGFCNIHSSTTESSLNAVKDHLGSLNLDIKNIRGYDNSANMRDKHNGLQKRILEINPRAFFVPCAARALNLVVNDAANVNFQTVDFFSCVQELYVFLSSSTYRWETLKKHLTNLTLKPVSETRWERRIESIRPLR